MAQIPPLEITFNDTDLKAAFQKGRRDTVYWIVELIEEWAKRETSAPRTSSTLFELRNEIQRREFGICADDAR